MTEEIIPFDPKFLRAVEEIDGSISNWRNLLRSCTDARLIDEKFGKSGFDNQLAQSQLMLITKQSSDTLIQTYLNNGKAAQAACAALQIRTSEDDKKKALSLLQCSDANERILGTRMLTYDLGMANQPEAIFALQSLVKGEKNEKVLEKICYALYHLMDIDIVFHLKHLVDHKSVEVRNALAVCFFGTDDPDGINALVELSDDPELEIRKSAVTGLGRTIESSDDEESLAFLKNIFLRHLEDEDRVTRLEAISALSKFRTKEKKAILALNAELDSEFVPLIAIDAARAFASSLLHANIQKILSNTELNDPNRLELEKALQVCKD